MKPFLWYFILTSFALVGASYYLYPAVTTAVLVVLAVVFLSGVQQKASSNFRYEEVLAHFNSIDLSNKTVLVTGANSGVGYSLSELFASRGARVVMVCRSRSRGNSAVDRVRKLHPSSTVTLLIADLADLRSVRGLVSSLRKSGTCIDTLILNAGMIFIGGVSIAETTTSEGHNIMFASNYLGHFLLTVSLLPELRQWGTRVVSVTSITSSLGLSWDRQDPQKANSWNILQYSNSKACQSYFAFQLELLFRSWKDGRTTATSVTVDPGIVDSGIVDSYEIHPWLHRLVFFLIALPPKYAAARVAFAALHPDAPAFAGHFQACDATPFNLDKSTAKAVWDYSLCLVDLHV